MGMKGAARANYLSSPTITGTATLADAALFRWTTDLVLKRYAAAQLSLTGDGTGATTNAGWILGYEGTNSGYSALWSSGVTPSASNYALRANATTAFLGSTGTVQIGISNTARINVTSTAVTLAANTATPANGSAAAAVTLGTTAAFGIYYGSGAPSVSAAKGSLYLRSDGSGTTDRAYINTDGSTAWTALTTAG